MNLTFSHLLSLPRSPSRPTSATESRRSADADAIARAFREGRSAERKRMATIFTHPIAVANVERAAELAFTSSLSAKDAIAVLKFERRAAREQRQKSFGGIARSWALAAASFLPGYRKSDPIAASWEAAAAPYCAEVPNTAVPARSQHQLPPLSPKTEVRW